MKRIFTVLTVLMLCIASMTQAHPSVLQTKPATAQHLKKDGTPDKRFKENKAAKGHLKKDGTPDKRFKANKVAPKKK